MEKHKIFISSVQKEFKEERAALRDFIMRDPLCRRYFDIFLFEDIPARDRNPDSVYLEEVGNCDLYLCLLGNKYGIQDGRGVSSTEREFCEATEQGKTRLLFIKTGNDKDRHRKTIKLIKKAGGEMIRRRFSNVTELITQVYAALVQYLEDKGVLQTVPFDAAVCRGASFSDIDEAYIENFLETARAERKFPLPQNTTAKKLFAHLNLITDGKISNAAILLFCRKPQKFRHLMCAEVKCMHFHTLEKRKPIPSYQIYKGSLFDLVDQAVDFVMSKLNRFVGTRAKGPQAPVEYDIPKEVVAEGIVNAIAHRDYTSNASVEVQVFPDRIEIWNPGTIHPPLTLEKLLLPHASQPNNPLIAEPLFLTKYIEKAGSGTIDMVNRCQKAGMRKPEFKIDGGFFILKVWRKKTKETQPKPAPGRHQVGTKSAPSRHQVKMLQKCAKQSGITELMKIAGRSDRTKFRNQVLNVLIEAGLLEMTYPNKPRSSKQKYRLTKKGKGYLRKAKSRYDR